MSQMMQDLVKQGVSEFGLVGLKGEFEAEGASLSEIHALADLASVCGVALSVKIGGCEAIRDLTDLLEVKPSVVIAPMIESVFALKKYENSIQRTLAGEDSQNQSFFFNVETISGFEVIDSILDFAASSALISGVVFGRGDFAESLGLPRNLVDDPRVTTYVLEVARKTKIRNLKFVVGGSVTESSGNVLEECSSIHLNEFETRKVVFDSASGLRDLSSGLNLALRFELEWLRFHSDASPRFASLNSARIKQLELRFS